MKAALMFEFVTTLVFVTAIPGATQPDAPAGFAVQAIGLTQAAIHHVGINATGVSVNPVRSFGPQFNWGALADLWLFIVVPRADGGMAGLLNRATLPVVRPDQKTGPTKRPA